MRQVNLINREDVAKNSFVVGLFADDNEAYDAAIDGAVSGLCVRSGRTYREELEALVERLGTPEEDERMENSRPMLDQVAEGMREVFARGDFPIRYETNGISTDDGEIALFGLGGMSVIDADEIREPTDDEIAKLLEEEGF